MGLEIVCGGAAFRAAPFLRQNRGIQIKKTCFFLRKTVYYNNTLEIYGGMTM
jgi:hypothetical protein